LLPHGYEGQGPDHSSARIERFLQLAAEDAITIAQPSTPASHFHLLRQQALGEQHRPLVVMTPKKMLRMKTATSDPSEFTSGEWRPVLNDPTITDPGKVTTVLLCSGRVRWELAAEREKQPDPDSIAIVALERLYPLPAPQIASVLSGYRNARDVRWVQEEPENQGAWPFMALNLPRALREANPDLDISLTPVTRPASSAPSVGSAKAHEVQQRALMEAAFG
jgi:multifunctional 2-oxoglutarate metabolism enzyme